MNFSENKEWLKNYYLVLDFLDEQSHKKKQYWKIYDNYIDLLWYPNKKAQLELLEEVVKVIKKEKWGKDLVQAINKMKTML